MPKSFSPLGQDAKLAHLRTESVNKLKGRCFFRVASQRAALTGARYCFGSFASAIRRYFSFRELRRAPPFPATATAAVEWVPIFNTGPTCLNYINYLEKACYYLDRTADWVTPALADVIKGLRLEGEAKFRCPNFTDISMAVSIIKRENKIPNSHS